MGEYIEVCNYKLRQNLAQSAFRRESIIRQSELTALDVVTTRAHQGTQVSRFRTLEFVVSLVIHVGSRLSVFVPFVDFTLMVLFCQ